MGGSNTLMLESDDTSSMMSDDVEPGIYLPRSRHENHRFGHLPVEMAIYPQGKEPILSIQCSLDYYTPLVCKSY